MYDYRKIFWIPSYPKSGNTWLRLILSGLFFTKDGNISDLNILNEIPKFDTFNNFKFIKNISSTDYNNIFNDDKYNEKAQSTLAKYWLKAQKNIKLKKNSYCFFKTHNARIKYKKSLYTNEITTLGFIYVLRDPRDIVVSYSKHMDKSLDSTINFIIKNNIMGNQNTLNRMPEFIFNWKDHYRSWKNFVKVPSIFIKYEDLLNDIEKEIKKIINFFSENYNIEISNIDQKIKNIIYSTKFVELQNIEKIKGFSEKSEHSNFFRHGKKNQWKNILSKEQKLIIEKYFEKEMIELKYK